MTLTPLAGWAVAVMAKRPAPRHTKTRLIPRLGAAGAAEFYEHLLLDTLDRVSALSDTADCAGYIAVDEPSSASYFTEVAPALGQVTQVGANLGERLDSVLQSCLANGHNGAFAIGSDSPDIPAAHFTEALTELSRPDIDVVLGPAVDGGYYLIGWKRPWPQIVTEVQMSTPTVLADTLGVASRLNCRVALIESWRDIDEPADLDSARGAVDPELAPRTAAFLAGITI